MPNPKKNAQGGQPDVLENQPNILAEEQDMEDELEENVGTTPRKVTMEEYTGAEEAFNDLVKSEEVEYETTPFRPGKTKFVLTERQEYALEICVDEIGKYLEKERSFAKEEANQKLLQLQQAMKKTMEKGLDSLNPEERKTISEYNEIMGSTYRPTESLIDHIRDCKNPYELTMSNIHAGLDMLGVMTGIPAAYKGSKPEDYKEGRAKTRKKIIDNTVFKHPEEVRELLENADSAGLKDLTAQFKGTEIGKKLGLIGDIVGDLRQYKSGNNLGQYDIEKHLPPADELGTFLNAKDKNGKSNYDIIAESILAKKNGGEQKKAFDMLLGQLNTVCSLDIGVPFAIEAMAENEWKKNEKKKADRKRINDANRNLFGAERKVRARDKEFLESVDFLKDMIATTMRNKLDMGTEHYSKMFNAHIGFKDIVEKVRSNYANARLDEDSERYVDALDFGNTLHMKKDGKTLYEHLAEAYESKGKTREDLDNTLLEMSEKFGMKIAIPGQEIEGKTGPVEQHTPYVKKIKEVQRSSNRMEDPVQLKMALASVLALRRMSVDPAHKDHKKVRTKAAYAKAVALMETKAFKELTKDLSDVELAKKIYHPGNFDKEFTKKLEELDLAEYNKRLQDKSCRSKLAHTARNSAAKMKETGTGVYLLGVKRGSNSGMYDRAVLAMQQAAKNPDAATTMKSVQTVKEYLSNKMTRRKSPSGRERWKDCMEFLHEAMPEEEFKEYCDQINAARKVKKGSSDYIEPKDFMPGAQRNSVPAEPEKKAEAEKDQEEIAEGPGLGRNSV